jgi:CelD/BcsL family acetyltransferase involved in cellulose biosynthesis
MGAGLVEAPAPSLKADVARHASEWDWMVWNGIPADSAAAETLGDGVTWNRYTPYYTLRLEGDWPTFRSRLRRNVKESLRKCYNSLKRDGLDWSFEVVSDPEEMLGALNEFFRLHAERATIPSSINHANVFAEPNARTFLVEVCERLAARGQAYVFRLRVGQRVVATRVGFLLGGTLYLYFSGYQREFGKYSVMTTVLAEVIQHAFRTGIGSINLSSGNDVSKTRWAPREWLECDGVTVSSRPLGRLAYTAYQLLEITMLPLDVRRQIRRVVSGETWRKAHDVRVKGEHTVAQAVAFVVSGGVL